jgi:hypothetical protein
VVLPSRDASPFAVDPVGAILGKVDKLRDLSTVTGEDTVFIMDIMRVFDWLSLWLDYFCGGHAYGTGPDQIFSAGIIYDRLNELQTREWTCRLQAVKHDVPWIWDSVCPASLWNVVISQNDQYNRVLAMVDHLKMTNENPFPGPRRKHDRCTAQLCVHAYEDTTKIKQLHMCSNQNCPTVTIPIEQLANLFEASGPWATSAWDITSWDPDAPVGMGRVVDKIISDRPKNYMAVSHVWSDGTGIGLKKQGTVNSCLMDFWVRIAKEQHCEGLWWDTICLPTDPQHRRNALNVMLSNFSNAALVVIHDRELANTHWTTGDVRENPAIAITLSEWFTRGWTAAELSAAPDNVLVVLKNPNPNSSEPYTVSLATILANRTNPLYYSASSSTGKSLPTLAHLSATSIIGMLHKADHHSLRRRTFEVLMSILKSRSTAWEKDRMVIAMLIYGFKHGEDLDTSLSVPELTQSLLLRLHDIPKTALFHSEVPMADRGPWSWCPPSIFGLGSSGLRSDRHNLHPNINITTSGRAEGWFYATALRDGDEVCPFGSHPLVVTRIQAALETPAHCLLLRADTFPRKLTPVLLVIPVDIPKSESLARDVDVLPCRYVGCVYHISIHEQQDQPQIKCSIGNDINDNRELRTGVSAEDSVSRLIRRRTTYMVPDKMEAEPYNLEHLVEQAEASVWQSFKSSDK